MRKPDAPAPSFARAALDTEKLRALVVAVDAGSLSGAARILGGQLSTLSRHVAELERTVGVELLRRTGRGVRPTVAGARFAERARGVLVELEAASTEARGEPVAPMLRISAPVELSLQLVPAVLDVVARRHPQVAFVVQADRRRVSLLEEDYDVAVRLGPLQSSHLLARKVGDVSLVFVAPGSLAASLRTVRELAEAEHVLVASTPDELVVFDRGRETRLPRTGRVRVSTFTEAAALAAISPRVAWLPSFTAATWLREGRLARVLPRLRLEKVPLHVLYPARHRGSSIVRDLGDALADALDGAERSIRSSASPSGTSSRRAPPASTPRRRTR